MRGVMPTRIFEMGGNAITRRFERQGPALDTAVKPDMDAIGCYDRQRDQVTLEFAAALDRLAPDGPPHQLRNRRTVRARLGKRPGCSERSVIADLAESTAAANASASLRSAENRTCAASNKSALRNSLRIFS